jgi:hypothetical protein
MALQNPMLVPVKSPASQGPGRAVPLSPPALTGPLLDGEIAMTLVANTPSHCGNEEEVMKMSTSLWVALGATLVSANLALAEPPSGPTSDPSGATMSTGTQAKTSPAPIHLSKHDSMALQKALTSAGLYKGKVDGRIGKQTTTALRSYQQANNLDVTGQPDAETLAKLGIVATPASRPATNESGASATRYKK